MHKEVIKFNDFLGNEREEDFFFNLTEAELTKMQLTVTGGFRAMVQRIMMTQDTPALIAVFEDMIQKSYGVISADGRRFDKSSEILADFMNTQAYSNLYMKLVKDADAAAEFINGILPADLAKQIESAPTTAPTTAN